MKILIACEESQRVCEAFRKRGHEAYSCDILAPSGGFPEWHIMDDDIVPETIVLCSEIIKAALKTVPPYIKNADDYILDRIRRLVKDK